MLMVDENRVCIECIWRPRLDKTLLYCKEP